MKKWIAPILCGMLAFSLTACNNSALKPENSNTSTSTSISEDSQQIPNPFIEFKTMDEAEKEAGFTFTEPSTLPEGYSRVAIYAIKDDLIEVIYKNGDNEILLRKSKGSADNSGNYSVYDEIQSVTVQNVPVELRGTGGAVHVAVWNEGNYAYSIGVREKGLDRAAITDMIESIPMGA